MIIYVEHEKTFGRHPLGFKREYPYAVRDTTMVRLSAHTFLTLKGSLDEEFWMKISGYSSRDATEDEQYLYKMTRIRQKIKEHC